jgi:hypothetical protein
MQWRLRIEAPLGWAMPLESGEKIKANEGFSSSLIRFLIFAF